MLAWCAPVFWVNCSQSITSRPLSDHILDQNQGHSYDTFNEQLQNKAQIGKLRNKNEKSQDGADGIYQHLPEQPHLPMDLAKQKGGPFLVNCCSLSENAWLHTSKSFLSLYHITLRYRWTPINVPPTLICLWEALQCRTDTVMFQRGISLNQVQWNVKTANCFLKGILVKNDFPATRGRLLACVASNFSILQLFKKWDVWLLVSQIWNCIPWTTCCV